ncbi:MAG: sensor histidine kinase [Solirubrobacteraceae bacterium]
MPTRAAFWRRVSPSSLRVRLVLAAGGSIVAAVALFGLLTSVLVWHELHSALDGGLRRRALQVAELAISDPAVLTAPGALESPISGRQIAVEVIDARGRILARSLTLGAALLPDDALARRARLAGRPGYENVSIGGRPFRLYAAPIPDAFGPAAGGAVLVASETSDIGDTLGHLAALIVLVGAAIAVGAVVVAAVLTRRGLTPLSRLAAGAREIELSADPSHRLPAGVGADDEIEALTGVLNRMLSSLERARESERRFLADASHELRTPVTTLLGNIEYTVRHGADDEVLADLERDAARLARLVDDLLALEREGARGSAVELVDVELASLARGVVSEYRESGEQRVSAGVLDELVVRGDAAALERALGNLVDNALSHGEGEVSVSLLADGSVARLSVSDQGPGPDPEQRERLFERFWRGAGSERVGGSGLGLSIVAAIASRHGGTVSVEGSTFIVELPLLTPDS